MKHFYKNKKVLIAMASLLLCFTLNSKTMAVPRPMNNQTSPNSQNEQNYITIQIGQKTILISQEKKNQLEKVKEFIDKQEPFESNQDKNFENFKENKIEMLIDIFNDKTIAEDYFETILLPLLTFKNL